ncbi:hypothetical protein BATDEDRAFT_34632 [Batrachochytrium dendrobatidis JAM81]|uniref:RCC1-like domain-containing protein n=1 Tax=Batrachochytrium dendrobatidis (strain JAM81 / FGSC 10211) TaxID=684364 RepID=F4NXP7_BATDJ|nr:uncharacterized protein BATDEDRAFT_34632 [Batrachochytrium dendrobatidis JAM81]EGF82179.1 hypothetical protein BATDEDRAFT_34632 [Batrachochytrium dendrobatidis JAM81]|eukprot:XP_006677434.1 hypothetical protein BATDEDRAFT_34632 [Batrachochytrium dendrobatidis JAM81]
MLYTAGSNAAGQLGTGSLNDASTPTLTSHPGSCQQLAGGANHSILLDSLGQVFVCGDNAHGQLGISDTSISTIATFIPVHIHTAHNDPIVYIACGWQVSFAVSLRGAVWVAGCNLYGQAGLSLSVKQTDTCNGFINLSAIHPQLPSIKKTACGLRHTLFLGHDGSLWGCGSNRYGQLLNLIDSDSLASKKHLIVQPRLLKLQNSARVLDVACGQNHSIALVSGLNAELAIYTFGQNKHGQLAASPISVPHTQGNPDPFIHVPITIQTTIPQEQFIAVFAGWSTSGVVCESGHVFIWGRNDHGQLAVSKNPSSMPNQVNAMDLNLFCSTTPCLLYWYPQMIVRLDSKGLYQPLIIKTKHSKTGLVQCAIAAGSEHIIAIAFDHHTAEKSNENPARMQCISWGWNEHGNCGIGNTLDILVPTVLNGISTLDENCVVGAGAGHSLIWTPP